MARNKAFFTNKGRMENEFRRDVSITMWSGYDMRRRKIEGHIFDMKRK